MILCIYHLCLLILSHMIRRGISQPTSAPVLSNLDCTSYSNEDGYESYGCSFSTVATCAPGDSAAVECSESLWSHMCVHTQIHTLAHLVTQSHACICHVSKFTFSVHYTYNLCIYIMLTTSNYKCILYISQI